MYRALHILSYETRDRMVWRALDALAEDRGGETGEVLKTAATAVLSEEALGAHGADRSEERIGRLLEAMEAQLAGELGVPADRTGARRGIRRLR